MRGEEEAILKHKVKVRDMSQNRIIILWIETKQANVLDLLREPNFKCIKSSQKLGRVTVVYRCIPDYKQRV